MIRHLYAFGSLCRGEIDRLSDVDLLACVADTKDAGDIDRNQFSIYTRDRLRDLWKEGNPFAWHLHLESRLVYSSDGLDFLVQLGAPHKYSRAADDCAKFSRLFDESWRSLIASTDSQTFHLSCLFLATRNFATCYSFLCGRPIFSRSSPLLIDSPAPLSKEVFSILVRARVLSTRGLGEPLSSAEIDSVRSSCPSIREWMSTLSNSEAFL